MGIDPTETARREMTTSIGRASAGRRAAQAAEAEAAGLSAEDSRKAVLAAERAAIAEKHGDVYDTAELRKAFTVLSFLAPFCVVVRKADSVRGLLMFQHQPRFYYGFSASA